LKRVVVGLIGTFSHTCPKEQAGAVKEEGRRRVEETAAINNQQIRIYL
jgi:hypothetical protein